MVNKKNFKIIGICIFLSLIFVSVYANLKIWYGYQNKIFSAKNVPQKKVWLVLWAWVKNNALSSVYKDRLLWAIQSYKQGKINKILISWDNGKQHYDELTPAKNFLLKNNIPQKDIYLDYAGFDTYDSIYRAKYIFENTSLNVFTQTFHLKRALYICEGLEIDCHGVATDYESYVNLPYFEKRELLARIKAFFDVQLDARPKFLWEKISIL